MKIVIPMAGRGKRLRPHTLTTPKPLVHIAGKPIVQRLVEDIVRLCDEPVTDIGFIIGDFGAEVEAQLQQVAKEVGAKGHVFHQEEALGTAHAIFCAEPLLQDDVIIAFADTLFRADFSLKTERDGIIWVKEVDDPSAYGVVKLDEDACISAFVEKPKEFVSNRAIIGIYYFRHAEQLRDEIKHLLDNNLREHGEFQITNALEAMKQKGAKLETGAVQEWLDCGNKRVTVATNSRYLHFLQERGEELIHESVSLHNSTIIPPVFLGEGVSVTESVIGPNVAIGKGTQVKHCVIQDSLIGQQSELLGLYLQESMIGNEAKIGRNAQDLSAGDFSELKI